MALALCRAPAVSSFAHIWMYALAERIIGGRGGKAAGKCLPQQYGNNGSTAVLTTAAVVR